MPNVVGHLAPAMSLALTHLAVSREVPQGSLFVTKFLPGQLQFATDNVKVVPATPVKRRGKSMSRRTGQDGHFEKSGKWWVVRWWMDVPGQEKRFLKRAKVCPISGPGTLSESARKRRGREIIAESGADTVSYTHLTLPTICSV